MTRVYISIGSNIHRYHHVTAALDALRSWFGELRISPVYETESVGFDGSDFLNLVVGIDTDWSVGALQRAFKALESDNGREAGAPKFSPRTLDLDILTYGSARGVIDGVPLPRAEILDNAFVLKPLADLAPDERHPVTGQPYGELWRAYRRNQKLWPVAFEWRGLKVSDPVGPAE